MRTMGADESLLNEIARGALDGLLEGCQVLSFDWTYLYVNDALVAQAQRTREELIGHTVMALFPGVEATPLFDELRRSMTERRHHWMETEFVFPDGRRRWFELRFVPVSVGLCVLSADVTERRHTEHALREGERAMRDLHAAIPDALFLVLDDGSIVGANRDAERMFGHAEGALLGRRIEELLPESARAPHVAHRHAFAANPKGRRMGTRPNLTALRSDGAEFPVDVSIGPASYQGRPAVLAIVRDMTEHHRLEERLRQTQKLEALGALAGGVAHDFNNLLSVILSYSSMLVANTKPSDPIRDDLEEIHAAGLRASDLTRQLLAFGRRQILQPRSLCLNDVIEGVERMLHRMLGEHVELTLLPAANLGVSKLDAGQVEQVLVNLVINARDAMPEGGKLTIETANVELDAPYATRHGSLAPGPYVMLAVSDTGVGMTEETRARIFEPFFTTKGRGQGTGLGLATVFGVVKQSGGHIWVYSEVGRGTTFKIYFPRSDGDVAAPLSERPPPSNVVRGAETVLLVEDDEHVRTLVRTILKRHGYHVLEAQNGGDALLICEQHGAKIHLLVTDVVMPRMSGRNLAARLKTLRPDMRVLYMSGYTDNSVVHHGVLDSDVAFLQKPITPDVLVRKVREVLDAP